MNKKLKLITISLVSFFLLGGGGLLYSQYKKEQLRIQFLVDERKILLQKKNQDIKAKITLLLANFEKIKQGEEKDNDWVQSLSEEDDEILNQGIDSPQLKEEKEKLRKNLKLLRELQIEASGWIERKNKEKENIKKKYAQWQEKQKNNGWKKIVAPFVNDSEIFNKTSLFIKNIFNNFFKENLEQKKIYKDIYFSGFNSFFDRGDLEKLNKIESENSMGFCSLKGSSVEIYLNKMYLLSLGKAGKMDKFINEIEEKKNKEGSTTINIYSFSISFSSLIETIAHEIAHALQFLQYKKSSCESNLGTEEYIPELADEHFYLREKIEKFIKKSNEYRDFKNFWEKQ